MLHTVKAAAFSHIYLVSHGRSDQPDKRAMEKNGVIGSFEGSTEVKTGQTGHVSIVAAVIMSNGTQVTTVSAQ